MAALQEIPGSQRRSPSTAESLFHMIACCSYHLAKVHVALSPRTFLLVHSPSLLSFCPTLYITVVSH